MFVTVVEACAETISVRALAMASWLRRGILGEVLFLLLKIMIAVNEIQSQMIFEVFSERCYEKGKGKRCVDDGQIPLLGEALDFHSHSIAHEPF